MTEVTSNLRKGHEIGIVGSFLVVDGLDYGKNIPFGGYFDIVDDSGVFVGKLVDRYGSSVITGQLENAELKFSKVYKHELSKRPLGMRPYKGVIHYHFQQKQGHHWFGRYRPSDDDIERKKVIMRGHYLPYIHSFDLINNPKANIDGRLVGSAEARCMVFWP